MNLKEKQANKNKQTQTRQRKQLMQNQQQNRRKKWLNRCELLCSVLLQEFWDFDNL